MDYKNSGSHMPIFGLHLPFKSSWIGTSNAKFIALFTNSVICSFSFKVKLADCSFSVIEEASVLFFINNFTQTCRIVRSENRIDSLSPSLQLLKRTPSTD
ncbi:hypothetical protein ACTFIW_005464 [Dictyostelium discoideum]